VLLSIDKILKIGVRFSTKSGYKTLAIEESLDFASIQMIMIELVFNKEYGLIMRLSRNNPFLKKNPKNKNLFDGEVDDGTI